MQSKVKLVKPMYPCQDVPVVVFEHRCSEPCLYCDLQQRQFSRGDVIASGKEAVLKALRKFKGAYFSAVSECFAPENRTLAHHLIENVLNADPNFVPLIVTKQTIPQKTIELLARNRRRIVVQYSIPSLNNKVLSALEPGSASVSQRLKTIKKLTSAGVPVIAVVMPWFGIYDKNEHMDDLPRALREAGVLRCRIGTAVLPESQSQKIRGTGNRLILDAVEGMTEKRKVTTKTGYTLPFKERVRRFSELVKAFEKFGIRAKICAADNIDLIGKVDFPVCTKLRHRNLAPNGAKKTRSHRRR